MEKPDRQTGKESGQRVALLLMCCPPTDNPTLPQSRSPDPGPLPPPFIWEPGLALPQARVLPSGHQHEVKEIFSIFWFPVEQFCSPGSYLSSWWSHFSFSGQNGISAPRVGDSLPDPECLLPSYLGVSKWFATYGQCPWDHPVPWAD